MKTFEERYTAWIDGQLEGSALGSFEQELARRAAAGEAQNDRKDTQRLRLLLRSHLEAPVLNNPEFFSHQLRERLEGERASVTGRAPAASSKRGLLSLLFPWSVTRLAWAGAACLFVAAALYYGLEPSQTPGAPARMAQSSPAKPSVVQPEQNVADSSPAPAQPRNPAGDGQLAKNYAPTPAPLFDDSPDIQVHPPQNGSPASATPLIYPKPNVNVLWTNGLDYLPDVPEAAGTPANAPAPAPSASVAP